MMKQQIAHTLRELRENKKLSRKQVANMIKKSEKTIDAWENARAQPDIECFFQLCRIYGVENIEKTFETIKIEISEQQKIHEQKLIDAYRKHTDMQAAVDRLLKIENE